MLARRPLTQLLRRGPHNMLRRGAATAPKTEFDDPILMAAAAVGVVSLAVINLLPEPKEKKKEVTCKAMDGKLIIADSMAHCVEKAKQYDSLVTGVPAAATSDAEPAAATLDGRNPDRLRIGPVRLLGYANELGESFRPLVPNSVVLASYGVAGAYVAADAAWRSTCPPPGRGALTEAADTFVWQGLASVAIPGFVINRIVWAVGRVSPASIVKWSPTAAGLCCIPFIIKPIDHGVDLLMESVFRPFYPGAAGGAEKSD